MFSENRERVYDKGIETQINNSIWIQEMGEKGHKYVHLLRNPI